MHKNDAEFQQRIRAAFEVEAREHLRAVASGLLALESKAPELDANQLDAVFRHTHSLKGAARAAGFARIEAACQALETVFVRCKERRLALAPADYDLLHQAFDQVGQLIGSPDAPELEARLSPVVKRLESLVTGARERTGAASLADAPAAPKEEKSEGDGAVPGLRSAFTRVSTPDLDQLLRTVEDMLTLKHRELEQSRHFADIEQEFVVWQKRWSSLQVPLRKLRLATQRAGGLPAAPAAKICEFLDWTFGYMKALENRVDVLSRSAAQDRQATARHVDDLLSQSKNLLMLPFSRLVDWLPKMVRDLARSQGKHAELVLQGDEVQIDKRLIDEMRDPLIHLLRNAVDHGVEEPAVRVAAGKPEKARIELRVRFASADRIELVVEDDGRGIDAGAVRDAAVRCGVIGADAAAQLSDEQTIDLIFRSDVSTSPLITELSGRGVGLAIVREQVEKLGGQVFARSTPGRGTTFHIALPQSLGVLRGLFVRVGEATFVLPGMHVACVARLPHAALRTVQNRETVTRAGRVIPLAPLGDVLQQHGYHGLEEADLLTVVFLEAGSDALALAVDEVLDDEEILIKRLEPPLLRVRNIAGATVSASGKVLPVLNVPDLVKSARRLTPVDPARRGVAKPRAERTRAKILLAEDSITSRLLLKGILESAGHQVRTAVDGIDAFTALRSGNFDLLVSDIEMPRLNGFDLTSRIRSDPVLANLPIVLVTALATREDRERGIEAGANAYILKGSFDQRDLIDAVRRLIAQGERA